MENSSSILDLEIVVVDGNGDWARAFINKPDPAFAITQSVFMVAASNPKGTVTLVLWGEIYQGTPEYQVLLDLLTTALSRL